MNKNKNFLRFIFWVIAYSFIFWFASLILSLIGITNQLIYILLVGLIIAITTKLLKRTSDKWRIGLSLLFVIILILANTNYATNIKEFVKDSSLLSNENSQSNTNKELLDKCTQAFNACKEIGEAKGNSINLLKKGYFNNSEEANKFYKTWRGFQQSYDLESEASGIGESISYPVTLFAVKAKSEGSEFSNAIVVICSSNCRLLEVTSAWMCGG